MSISCEDVVLNLKEHKLSTTAKHTAYRMGVGSRAIATALRRATRDGRVSLRFKRGVAWYRFVRMTPKKGTP